MMRIIAIDDSPTVTKIFEKYFSTRNFSIETANTPFGASNRIRQFNPDVLLMDIDMPGLSGNNLIKVLKESGVTAGICTIIVSSNEVKGRETVRSGMAAGYFVKGEPLEQLEKLILSLISPTTGFASLATLARAM